MTHYILEFAAVLLGISASLYAENVQELQRNERIKNQSLTRIQHNIAQDIADMEINIGSHQDANVSCNWVLANKHTLASVNPDSLGMHCVHCVHEPQWQSMGHGFSLQGCTCKYSHVNYNVCNL